MKIKNWLTNKKIISFAVILLSVFGLSGCKSHKVSNQSTQDILMSKTWDEADSDGTINWQLKFNKKQVKTSEGNASYLLDYKITKKNKEELITIDKSEPFSITTYKDGYKLSPINKPKKETEKRTKIISPH